MQPPVWRWLFLGALCVVLSTISAVAEEKASPVQSNRPLPKLFDFNYFKQLFGKQYATWSEELARRRLFFARALGAFVSGMRYKFRLSPNYNAVNSGSDATPEERARSRNRLMAQRSHSKMSSTSQRPRDESIKFLPDEHEDVEKEVRQYLNQHGEQLGLNKSARTKRDTELDRLGLRDLSLDQLIKRPTGQTKSTFSVTVESNNPKYVPIEVPSYGLTDQQQDIKLINLSPVSLESVESQLTRSLYGVGKGSRRGAKVIEEDEVFVDHRDCMSAPRRQGTCGACYAFASMSIMEWIYCKKTGKRGVEFSEQYMIDCGNKRFFDPDVGGPSMRGCDGALDESTAKFIHNFGLELRKKYPYTGREGQCPYDEDFDLTKTGYIRMRGADIMSTISRDDFQHFVKHAPIYVGFSTGLYFEDYGGGIVEAKDCGPEADHAMVLVGHGRLDGREYFLIRNSFGADWGEDGYMKLDLDSIDYCLDNGITFGTSNGVDYNLSPVKTKNMNRAH